MKENKINVHQENDNLIHDILSSSKKRGPSPIRMAFTMKKPQESLDMIINLEACFIVEYITYSVNVKDTS